VGKARPLENLYEGENMICILGHESEKVSEDLHPGKDFPFWGVSLPPILSMKYHCPECEIYFYIWAHPPKAENMAMPNDRIHGIIEA